MCFRYDSELKPRSSPSLEEDEGFSDWTQRRERRRQQRLQELSQGGEEEYEEEEMINKPVKTSFRSSGPLQRQEEEKDRVRMEAERKRKEAESPKPEVRFLAH